MRTPRPLPEQLRNRVFSRAEAIELGIADQRLRRSDIRRIGPGLFRTVDRQEIHRPETSPERHAWSLPFDTTMPAHPQLIALTHRYRSCWFSHYTAARLYRLDLPHSLRNETKLHLSGVSSSPTLSRAQNIVLHRPKKLLSREIIELNSLKVSCPERVFIELMSVAALDDLIVIGDQLVREPRHGLDQHQHQHPWTTVERLRSCLEWHSQTPGAPTAREALHLVRVGSDSPPETALRLALMRAGLDEPELQIRLDPTDPYSPEGDMGYRGRRIVLQYEGQHHFTAEQQAADERRNWAFEADNWTVIRVNRVDLAEGFRHTIARLHHLLHG